ncbi:DNA polymerase Y family protein [Acidobacteria bacterium AB60]|nr:DNA polymerase Y family protein [Acidobacteria bacterium AB60]
MTTLFACIHAAEFPAQALVRLRPEMQSEPVVVMEGLPPHQSVCAMNTHAQRRGAALGMTRLDVEGIPGLRVLARSLQTESAARMVLLECAAKYSPRIEEVSEGTACAFVLDIAGTERLFGPPAQLAERLRAELAAAGFRASIAVSGNFETARMKAAGTRGIHVIPEGAEAVALARLPITALGLDAEHLETFAIWGIRTLGELAALPEVDLITRLGQQGRQWREAALGERPHLFRPLEPAFTLKEYCAFETPVEQIDSLLFVGARMIDSLVARACDRALSLALVTVRMTLESTSPISGSVPAAREGSLVHERVLRPAIPSADRKFLLKLLHLEIAAHPPQAAVTALELSAEAGHCGTVQLGLFTPQMPEPSRLDVTLARIKAIVGPDRVGAPMLDDTHRPGSFRMEPLALEGDMSNEPQSQRMVLRRMRPPLPVRVSLRESRPTAFRDGVSLFEVTAAYGPWKTSGCWWSAGEWNLEEWDVLAQRTDGSSLACLLVRDQVRNEWQLEAVYD